MKLRFTLRATQDLAAIADYSHAYKPALPISMKKEPEKSQNDASYSVH
jgi:hypothetical protein